MKRVTSLVAICCMVSLLSAPAVAADFFYTYSNVSGFPSITESNAGNGETSIDIALTMTSTASFANVGIRPAGADKKIRHLRVHASGGTSNAFLVVQVHNPELASGRYISRVYEISPAVGSKPLLVTCTDVGQLGASGDPALIYAASTGSISTRFDAGLAGYTGNAYATIVAVASGTQPGNVDGVTIGANYFGAIAATNEIQNINIAGNLGSVSSPASVAGKVVGSVAANSIYADISTTSSDATDYTGRIEARTGAFIGSLITSYITPTNYAGQNTCYIKTAGDLDADITLVRDVNAYNGSNPVIDVGGEFKLGRTISIGRILRGQSAGTGVGGVRVQSVGGLRGQIITNALNGSGNWDGPVTVGTGGGAIVLDPNPATPSTYAYSTSATSLGGGAIGNVPFRLHATDCEPASGDVVDWCTAVTKIRMRHYGPLLDSWDHESGPFPFAIWRRRIGTSNAWLDQSDCFTQNLDSSNSTIVELTPSVPLQRGYEYRVSLVQESGENVLRCDTPGAPPVADHTSEFIFSVGVDSPGDADDSGAVDFDDINAVLANWLATDCLVDGDADRRRGTDGYDVNFDDINAVLASWLITYTTCEEEMMMAGFDEGGGRTMSDALATMGFADAEKYATFLSELEPEQRILVLDAVDEWLNYER